MGQQMFKAVYFSDHPGGNSREKAVTLAFGQRQYDLHGAVKDLSSEEVRGLLGVRSFAELQAAAATEDLTVNRYCLRLLERRLREASPSQYRLPLEAEGTERVLFDPVQVTFRSGAKEPWLRWFPFPEGYSPKFVEAVLAEFAPGAGRLLDPFAGTGGSVFAASSLGMKSFFCEVNPVLQVLTLAKARVGNMGVEERRSLAGRLRGRLATLPKAVDSGRDGNLEASFEAVFGESIFFGPATYDAVLRVRTWLDEARDEDEDVGRLLEIAALASLVPSSRLKRAGDLRYRTPEEVRSQPREFLNAMRAVADMIATDVGAVGDGRGPQPVLVCEDARSLRSLPPLGVDAVVTSPPYVNGTNYFRNTKIELWFMRCLSGEGDLGGFRKAAVTAGINDVQAGKTGNSGSAGVETVVARLEEGAYDRRIPRMVGLYFGDLGDVFEGVCRHLKRGAVVAVDIGDSAYAGVRVPVQELLCEVLGAKGLGLAKEVTLRRRRSRDGSPLRQSLLVFRATRGWRVEQSPSNSAAWAKGWAGFKRTLPHRDEPFSKRNWGHPWHSLCSYMGKMKPSIAHFLVETFVPTGGRLLDPFAGVGTIPFEGALQGKSAFGFEISPSALTIAAAKMKRPDTRACREVLGELDDYLRNNRASAEELRSAAAWGLNGRLATYFETRTMEEVLVARRFFMNRKGAAAGDSFVLACLLHVLHGNRPYALSRRSHPITPYSPTGPFEYRGVVEKLRGKMERELASMPDSAFAEGDVRLQDATSWWPRDVDDLSAVVTSPPFFDSTRFFSANWMRLWFAGWSAEDFRRKPLGFVESRQKKGFDVYVPVIRQSRERLKEGGVLVLHLGKSATCDMAAEIQSVAKPWFGRHDLYTEDVSHLESHGIRDKGGTQSHQYLVLY